MTHAERSFERVGCERVFESSFVAVDRLRVRYADGEQADRYVVRHPGAVGVVVLDGDAVLLVRQPREAIDDPDSLEIPAGKLDPGEDPLACGVRELAEEIGKAATDWEPLRSFHPSVGMTDEVIHLFVASGLSDAHAEAEEDERIELVRWPLADLDGALAATSDAKTIVGLLLLRERLRARPA
ncbi:MAG TPA: NUDIX hydrolase [Solirubrobacteraceae bacterium]|nr:NUDIX hydrolase [Solirubrobacteraceae bacterium]